MSPEGEDSSTPRAAAGVVLRTASRADLPDLVRLERASFSDPWSESLLADEIATSDLLLVAESGGRAVAYAAFLEAADEGELLRVAVDPAHRRRGLGRRLLRVGLSELRRRGAARCHLEVRPSNEAALALYRGLGFEVAGLRPGYYSDGSHAMLLTLELEPAGGRAPAP